jgi:DNA-binding transcriptional LysR family regulator
MTIYQLDCFVKVAETLNFGKAAQIMCISQPAITYQIRAIEKELDVLLFERDTRHCRLTAAGQSFYQDAVQLTSFYNQSVQKAQDISKASASHLVVGIRKLFDYASMGKMTVAFREKYPQATVDIMPQDDAKPLEDLRTRRIDIGFYYSSEHSSCSDIAFVPLYEMNYYVLANPKHPLAAMSSLTLQDLRNVSVVTSGSAANFLSACQGPSLAELQEAGADLHYSAPSFESALIMLQANLAVLILPFLPDAVVPGMVKIPLLGCSPVNIEIAWMKGDTRLEIPAFVDIAKEVF